MLIILNIISKLDCSFSQKNLLTSRLISNVNDWIISQSLNSKLKIYDDHFSQNIISLYGLRGYNGNIREYVNTHIVHRWSDFDVNDIDDALTILMIMHAYRCKDSSPTKKEKIICNKLEDQILFWFEQLN